MGDRIWAYASKVGVGAVVVSVVLAVLSAPAFGADLVVPDPAPDPSMPGAPLVTTVLGWLKYGSIAAAIAGILAGGIAAGVGHFGGHMGAAMAARKWLLGGIGAAVIAGIAHGVVAQLYQAV